LPVRVVQRSSVIAMHIGLERLESVAQLLRSFGAKALDYPNMQTWPRDYKTGFSEVDSEGLESASTPPMGTQQQHANLFAVMLMEQLARRLRDVQEQREDRESDDCHLDDNKDDETLGIACTVDLVRQQGPLNLGGLGLACDTDVVCQREPLNVGNLGLACNVDLVRQREPLNMGGRGLACKVDLVRQYGPLNFGGLGPVNERMRPSVTKEQPVSPDWLPLNRQYTPLEMGQMVTRSMPQQLAAK